MTEKPRTLITTRDVYAVKRQMASMWIGRGPRVAELEKRMAAWVGATYGVVFGSGTAALTVALHNTGATGVRIPPIDCDALHIAARAADMKVTEHGSVDITVYPERGGEIEDFARHLPREREVMLRGRFGVFSFGALKDVTGGIGGCLVANEPFNVWHWPLLSPLSDINAALILSQLDHYNGHTRLREVADGKTWESPQ